MAALPVLFLIAAGGASPSAPTNLRCEYLTNPNCLEDAAPPRLSWTIEHAPQAWKQSAYRILVASDPRMLAQDKGDLWDSGQTQSDASIQIPFGGGRLASRSTCFWKVRVWGAIGSPSSWSKTQQWQIGLKDEAGWAGAQWIGATPAPSPTPAPHLRKDFSVKGKLVKATVYVAGVGYEELHLNGKKVAEGTERDPGYTNFDKRVLYVAHDVTPLIKQGANTIGAILGTGWYDTHDRATWNFDRAPWRGKPRLRTVLYLDYADGRHETISSDPSWKVATGPIVFDGIYTGEVYDARKEIPGWDAPGYNDSSWVAATTLDAPKGALHARQCPPVAILETIKPRRILEPKPGVYVVDFGQNIAGHARIHVNGPEGSKVTMRYSERITKDGSIERSEIDVYMTKTQPPQPFQTDEYILKGKGTETWEQRFSYSGFQYMEVTGFPGKPTVDNFEARLAATDVPSGGEFSCSNDLFNKIQSATRYSYLSNAQSIPTDCPQREKNGWTGDAHLACEAGLMNFRSESFYTKWLADVADDQKEDGNYSLIIPSGGWGQGALHPAWNSAQAIISDDMSRYLGDKRILASNYDGIKRYVDLLSSKSPDGFVPFDSLGDWLPWKTETSSQLTSTACLFIDAQIAAKAAALNNDSDGVAKYTELAAKVKKAFNEQYLKPDKINDATQCALSLAVFFNLAEGDAKKTCFDALVKNVETQKHIDCGIIGAKYVLRVLSEGGRSDLAYMLVDRKEQPGWGWWIGQGATTLWEDWKGESSLNHIMFGDVSNWFFQWIAGIGIDPAVPAFKHILIHPQPVGDLTWAKATEHSVYGTISSSWKRDGDRFHLDIVIPPNTSATVTLPGSGQTVEVGSGSYHYESKLAQ